VDLTREKLIIRKANMADENEITCCVNSSYENYIPRMGKKPKPMLEDYTILIENENVFVGVWKEQITGIIVLKDYPDYVLLDNVAVFPTFQGKGFGKDLIKFAEDYACRRGSKEIRLYTNIKMTENISIYKKLGYTEVDTKWEDGYHRVYFRKLLFPTQV